jgi:DNA-binding LacI/PurR family transcriptional regulator
LANYPQMDAVFVANDQMALAVLNAAHQHGIGVPQQLGVAGFDGISESAYFIPPLTTMRQNFRGLGAFAVRKILHLQEAGKDFPEVAADTTILTPELVVRESTLRI